MYSPNTEVLNSLNQVMLTSERKLLELRTWFSKSSNLFFECILLLFSEHFEYPGFLPFINGDFWNKVSCAAEPEV